jgi:Na+/H+ antiporter NhaD/arsenite permease-like protein
MKPLLIQLPTALVILLLGSPAWAFEGSNLGHTLPLWSVAAFVLMLLAIAILPLAAPRFWESNRNKLLISLLLGLPVVGAIVSIDPAPVVSTLREYTSFIILLTALFVISGGIVIRADLRATPQVNTGFLLAGSVLASFMGTTGAAILLIRPLLDTNRERTRVTHTVIFFIFLVGNIGGSLTPLGDPPLFMGYLAGVPFSWFFKLWPEWVVSNGVLLSIYYLWDRIQCAKEPAGALEADRTRIEPLRIRGLQNLPLLGGVVLAVAFLYEPVAPFPVREGLLVLLAAISWFLTPRQVRQENKFTFHPIIEVAVLFFGIFATMIPALLILNARGAELGLRNPASFFWASGGLSSFLDNTPTFVVFFSLAQSVGVVHGGSMLAGAGIDELLLRAISLGAVFMGANTYIGNAPNFMIKAIAEERGLKMPSFFGYMLYSGLILIPLFVLITLLYF